MRRPSVRQAVGRYRKGREITDRGQLAFLAVCLADLRVRDDAWARMDPEHRRRHLRLWTDVVTAAAPEFVPAFQRKQAQHDHKLNRKVQEIA